ncbi:cardiolipin synthase [Prolixibacteraceae bacterium JC049]|nr:cardiolipin synthase [Prolixibacteraceae bacterium JC049]
MPFLSLASIWLDLLNHLPTILTSGYVITMIFISVTVIMENRSPHRAISWIVVLALIPVGGVILYLFFGQTYRKQKIFSRKGLKNGLEHLNKLAKQQLVMVKKMSFNNERSIKGKKHLMKLLLNNSSALITDNNQVKLLHNGDQTFAHIIQALEQARHHIHLEYYIIEDDKIGKIIKNLLITKAIQGVQVRVIFDDVGSWGISKRFKKELKQNGVEIRAFMPVSFPWFTSRVNYRNHRKIIVVDGQIGFLGGLNIADRYIDGIPGIGSWRDTHVQIKGDAVATIQMQFISHWYFCSEQLLPLDEYIIDNPPSQGVVTQISASGPDSDWESISQAYFTAISTANRSVFIATPYFMPTADILTAIKTAAMKGVDIRLLIPEKSDTVIPKWCTESYIEELLEAGVRVFRFKNGFYHSKLMMVDGVWSSVGTANMDFRSLETNFEINAFFYNRAIYKELASRFIQDLSRSVEIEIKQWQKRPLLKKLKASFARLFSPLM